MSDTPANPEPESADAAPAGSPLPGGDFFVVGIGASAGGLAAISELLRHLSPKSSLALIVVQHLDPGHESLLVELLGRATSLPVEWAAHGRAVHPGRIYVAPRNTRLSVRHGAFVLQEPATGASHSQIDFFFRSLAEDLGELAVAVVLSGNGSDGAKGVTVIKRAGGLTFAQDEASAGHPSMPLAAAATGNVDRVLAPAAIAEELNGLAGSARLLAPMGAAPRDDSGEGPHSDGLHGVFRLLALRTGVDFTEYKRSTIHRRLLRRMVLTKAADLPAYLRLLETNREEVSLLYESLLINVTEFFRDPDCFEFLKTNVLPALIDRHADNSPIRIWVPGCSTGEEAYSLGILIEEVLEERRQALPVQIFATDVSDRAIATARAARYSAHDVANLSPERLRRFFVYTERGYVLKKQIRDMCIFARQNVAKDSPFSRLDLVSCRNLLIYLSSRLQRKLMPVFHYSLVPGGYLVLGTSESVGGQADFFRLIDRRYRVYVQKVSSRRAQFELPIEPRLGVAPPSKIIPAMPEDTKEPFDIIREADRVVLNRLGPTGVLINEELEVLQFRGDVSPYLAPQEGRASLNLVNMAREGLAAELQDCVAQAHAKNIRIQKAGVSIMQGDVPRSIDIDVTPIVTPNSPERFYLVLFAPADKTPRRPAEPTEPTTATAYLAQIDQLRQDLQATRNYLQATIERHETTNQELRAANEEIQSSNEELQSTNEELETAKEELQSTNEELTTVNEELHSRQVELIQLNNDLTNLINSVHLPIIILGQDMRIRRFTPMAEKVLNVIPSDVGRPLTDININLSVPDLPGLMAEVVESLTIREIEVQDRVGRWYSLRVRPYRTAENKIEGVVLTLIDIDQMKRTISQLEEARDLATAIMSMTGEWMVTLDDNLKIRMASEAFAATFGNSQKPPLKRSLEELLGAGKGAAELCAAARAAVGAGKEVRGLDLVLEVPGHGASRVSVEGRRVSSAEHPGAQLVLVLRRLT